MPRKKKFKSRAPKTKTAADGGAQLEAYTVQADEDFSDSDTAALMMMRENIDPELLARALGHGTVEEMKKNDPVPLQELELDLKPQLLTTSLIFQKNFPGLNLSEADPSSNEFKAAYKTLNLMLDNIGFQTIDNLELFDQVTHLYLQHNRIQVIENLDCNLQLRVLVLRDNQIEHVPNLTFLTHLYLLDLSHNKIEQMDTDDLPPKLMSIDLRGNPCTSIVGYRHTLVLEFPYLIKLDGTPVSKTERRSYGLEVSDDDDDKETQVETSAGDTKARFNAEIDIQHPTELQKVKFVSASIKSSTNQTVTASSSSQNMTIAPDLLDKKLQLLETKEIIDRLDANKLIDADSAINTLHTRHQEILQRARERKAKFDEDATQIMLEFRRGLTDLATQREKPTLESLPTIKTGSHSDSNDSSGPG